MKSFENKIAVITGAGSGIGKSLALQLAAQGAHLAIADVDEPSLQQSAAEIRQHGGEVYFQGVDVADREAVYAFADQVINRFGKVDVVINNAGIAMAPMGIEDLEYSDFEKIMGVNLWGVVHGTKAFLPHLLKQSEASLVNISSVFGLAARCNKAAYSTSKFAVRGFTEAIRQELSDSSVSVTVVFPGGVKTQLLRNARSSQLHSSPEELAAMDRKIDREVKTTPEQAAHKIIEGIRDKAARVLIGEDARLLDMLARKNPGNYGKVMSKFGMS